MGSEMCIRDSFGPEHEAKNVGFCSNKITTSLCEHPQTAAHEAISPPGLLNPCLSVARLRHALVPNVGTRGGMAHSSCHGKSSPVLATSTLW